MESAEIIAAVDAALRSSEPLRLPPHSPRWAQRPALEISQTAKDQLIETLRRDHRLVIFSEDYMQCFIDAAVRTSYERLAIWLAARANAVGAEQAVKDLNRYLTDESFSSVEVVALIGISIAEAVDMGEGIELVPFGDVPPSHIKAVLHEWAGEWPLGPEIRAAILCRTVTKKQHVLGPDAPADLTRTRQGELDEMRLVLTLVGPLPPTSVASWTSPEPWVPCGMDHGFGINLRWALGIAAPRLLTAEDVARGRELWGLYKHLENEVRQKLSIPLERLNQSLRERALVDKAIELGIAFEALFVPDRRPAEVVKSNETVGIGNL